MNSLTRIRLTGLTGLLLTGLFISSYAADSGMSRLRIDRWSPVGESADLDERITQQIARQMGVGHFSVRDVFVNDSAKSRLFSMHSVTAVGSTESPSRWVLCRGTKEGNEVVAGSADKIIQSYFDSLSNIAPSDEVVLSIMPEIVAALFYNDGGRWWTREAEALVSHGAKSADTPSMPEIKHDSRGRIFWRACYLRGDGGIDELSVTLSPAAGDCALFKKTELRRAGFFPATVGPTVPVEEWMIVKESSWRPPQRYRMMVMLASLGSAPKQFQLATALLQESDGAAREEGLKWLGVAAAQGYRDAVDLLEQSTAQLVRSDRDRDKVRLSRCCPVPGR